jgi:hypothetical protein
LKPAGSFCVNGNERIIDTHPEIYLEEFSMNETLTPFSRFFRVFIRPQTYLNLVYLLLAFPLGLFYFIFLVVGISTGISLIIIWVGILILAVVLAGSWFLAAFERLSANALLQAEILPITLPEKPGSSLWQRVKSYLESPSTWKGMLFLFLKFPLGLISFILTTVLLAISLGLMAAPLVYPYIPVTFFTQSVNTLPEALGVFLFGFLVLTGSLHVFNFYAGLMKHFSRSMFGSESAPVIPAEPPAVNTELIQEG